MEEFKNQQILEFPANEEVNELQDNNDENNKNIMQDINNKDSIYNTDSINNVDDINNVNNVDNTNEEKDIKTEAISEADIDVKELYRFLKDNDITIEVENAEELKDINDIADVVNKTVEVKAQHYVQQYLNSVIGPYRDLFEFIQKGGDVKEFLQVYNNTYENIDYNSIKNNIAAIDKVLFDYYRNTTKWDDNLIRQHLEKYNDDEKVKFGRNALEELKKIESYNKEQLFRQQEEQKQLLEKERKEKIDTYKKQIDEMKTIGELELTIKDKKEISDLLFNDITYNKLVSNFEKYRLNLVLLDKLGLLDNVNKLSDYIKGIKKSSYNFKKNKDEFNSGTSFIDFELITNSEKTKGEPLFRF